LLGGVRMRVKSHRKNWNRNFEFVSGFRRLKMIENPVTLASGSYMSHLSGIAQLGKLGSSFKAAKDALCGGTAGIGHSVNLVAYPLQS